MLKTSLATLVITNGLDLTKRLVTGAGNEFRNKLRISCSVLSGLFVDKRSFKFLSLGDSGFPFPGYISAGTSGVIRIDITKELKKWMNEKYEFIYSERMLEHIRAEEIPLVLANIKHLLMPGSKCRLSLPICFQRTIRTDMMRKGNYHNSKSQGHITWFTIRGYGNATEEFFGRHATKKQYTSLD